MLLLYLEAKLLVLYYFIIARLLALDSYLYFTVGEFFFSPHLSSFSSSIILKPTPLETKNIPP